MNQLPPQAPQIASAQQNSADATMETAHQDRLAPVTTLRNALLAVAATFSPTTNAKSGGLPVTHLLSINQWHPPAPQIASAQ